MANAQTTKRCDKTDQTGCGFCSKKRRVLHVSQFHKGQHICEPGSNKLKYKEGKHSLKAQYFHHAIIKEIKQRNDYQITFVLIHYSNVRGLKKGSILIKEEERNLKYNEIYIVEYKHQKYSPADIVERAIREAVTETEKEESDRKEMEKEKAANRETEKKSEKEAIIEEETEKEANIETEKEPKKDTMRETEKDRKKETIKEIEKHAIRETKKESKKESSREKESKKQAIRDTEKENEKEAIRETGKEAIRETEKESENEAIRETGKETIRDTEKEAIREKECEKEAIGETERKTKKEAIIATENETEKESFRETEIEATRETEIETENESIRETEKEAISETEKEAIRETEKESEKEAIRETEKKAIRETEKESKKGAIRETEKGTEKEANRDGNEVFQNTFGSYNLFVSNCEHFATWCVLGNKESFQIDDKWRLYLFPLKISSGVAGILAQFLLEMLRFFAFFVKEENKYGSGFALFVIGALYFIFQLVRYRLLCNYLYYKHICQYCYEEKKNILAIKLLWFITSGTLLYFVTEACMPCMFPAWPVTIVLHLIYIILSLIFRWVYNNLKSPFKCLPTKVEHMSDINNGDVITFRHFGFKHFAIVTEIYDSGEISVISYKGFFFITLKEYKISLAEKSVWLLRLTKQSTYEIDKRKDQRISSIHEGDHTILSTYKADQRISRMKSRLGEKKWHWRHNRSDHVCYWASIKKEHLKYYRPEHKDDKLNQAENSDIKSSLEVESIIVNLIEEIEVGDVVEFSTKGKNFKNGTGIITEIKDSDKSNVRNDRMFTLSLVTQTRQSITESEITVDLNTDTVEVKKFHPVHCRSMENRKNKAIQCANESSQQNNHFNMVEFCVLRPSRNYHCYFSACDFRISNFPSIYNIILDSIMNVKPLQKL